MSITYTKTSIFNSQANALVNPVNTVGVMGAGLAKEFKIRYPQMFLQYSLLCKDNEFGIGDLIIYGSVLKTIISFPTKEDWRNPSKVEYIRAGLEKFVKHHLIFDSVSFPKLGCGKGGLNWERQVKPLMEFYLGDLPIDIYIHI